MSDQRNGGIAWTEETWNPLRGCSRVSQGCVNCYAEGMAARFCGPGQPYEGTINPDTKRWNGKIRLVHEKLEEPLRWNRPRKVFVNSMSDLFHEDVPDEFIDKVFAVMALSPRHTFQVLTKRPERMLAYMTRIGKSAKILDAAARELGYTFEFQGVYLITWPIPNIWVGVTVENQEAANERIPLLLQTPAAVRWVSAEPLLSQVNIEQVLWDAAGDDIIDWLVVGGESGPNARPMHPDWARGLRDQCKAAGVPFLFKQWGEFSLAYDRDRDDPDWKRCAEMDRRPGRWINLAGGHGFHGDRVHYAERVGKKAAGRLLDGVLHDNYPREAL